MFWISVSYFFYSTFHTDQNEGRIPDWVYKPPRESSFLFGDEKPFISLAPIIKDNAIYYCTNETFPPAPNTYLVALRKDGSVIWRMKLPKFGCNQLDFVNDKIYTSYRDSILGQKIENSHYRSPPTYYFETLVIDPSNGKVLQKIPFNYNYISEDGIYVTDQNNLFIYNLTGKMLKKIPIPSPHFTRSPPYFTKKVLKSRDGFWQLNTEKNDLEFISDKGRYIDTMRSSDTYFCFSSFDGKYDSKSARRDTPGRIICRRQDNWENIFEVDVDKNLVDKRFYVTDTSLYTQRTPFHDENGYQAINLITKHQSITAGGYQERLLDRN